MNKTVVVTTIFEAPKFFDVFKNHYPHWNIVVVGDLKTPKEFYLERQAKGELVYMSPEEQEKDYKELSDLIGWNTDQRRCLGVLKALKEGADIITFMDDDNIPYPTGWDDILPLQEVEANVYESECNYFDPLKVLGCEFWFRGYPLSKIDQRDAKIIEKKTIKADVVQGLYSGVPDIDAVTKFAYDITEIPLEFEPFTSKALFNPFNTQNTFMSREIAKDFMMICGVGRVGDIWGSYQVAPCTVVYTKPTVEHDRNQHDLHADLRDELQTYGKSHKDLPAKSQKIYDLYIAETSKLD